MSRPLTGPLVRAGRAVARLVFAGFFVLPLALALVLALTQASEPGAWRALIADPQSLPAWRSSMVTAVSSSALALWLAMAVTTHLHGTRAWRHLSSAVAPMLAVPHAAFAIGFAVLVMPSGLLARLIAPFAGWDVPPDWRSVNDSQGIGMIVVLTLKELPFLLWNLVALLARPELSAQLERHLIQARTMGYASAQIWWRVLWPMLLPRLAWPMLAVLAYSLSVVDVALVIGPLSPPTLAVLAWQSLLDGDPASQALGAAQVLCLAATLAGLVGLGWLLGRGWQRLALHRALSGRRREAATRGVSGRASLALWLAAVAVYAAVGTMLAFAASAGPWPFPQLAPESWDPGAWLRATAWPTLAFSGALAGAAAVFALALTVAWLEATPAHWDAALMPVVLAPLAIPALLLMVGLYRGALALHLDGSAWGLLWVHVIVVLPYTLIVLAPAWRSFDPRYETTALALGRRRLAFWWRVKWPMQRAPMAAALSVGFAVAVAQYLPTLFIGAGRFATVSTEAVTLAAGGQRQTAAVYALWQALLPLLGFALASAARRPAASVQAPR